MKKIVALVVVSFFCLSSVSFAADNESWIQKIKDRFQKKDTIEEKKIPAPG